MYRGRGWRRAPTITRAAYFWWRSCETTLVAFLIGTVEKEIPIYRLDQFGFIHDVWVEPEYRNEGVGRQMTMLAIEKFRELGVKQAIRN